jgi:hypothetical protein
LLLLLLVNLVPICVIKPRLLHFRFGFLRHRNGSLDFFDWLHRGLLSWNFLSCLLVAAEGFAGGYLRYFHALHGLQLLLKELALNAVLLFVLLFLVEGNRVLELLSFFFVSNNHFDLFFVAGRLHLVSQSFLRAFGLLLLFNFLQESVQLLVWIVLDRQESLLLFASFRAVVCRVRC